MDDPQAEDELAMRQGSALYSVGAALRSTYDAENHDTLSRDATGLMIDLSHVPFEPEAGEQSGDERFGDERFGHERFGHERFGEEQPAPPPVKASWLTSARRWWRGG